jgi:hypothetical protein
MDSTSRESSFYIYPSPNWLSEASVASELAIICGVFVSFGCVSYIILIFIMDTCSRKRLPERKLGGAPRTFDVRATPEISHGENPNKSSNGLSTNQSSRPDSVSCCFLCS